MKKKIILINDRQFGYHNDTYFYCKYLGNNFDITYLCRDYNYKKNSLKNIKVIYISRNGSKVERYIRFITKIIKEIKKINYDLIFIKYVKGCSVLKIIYPKKKYILDIRSGSVNKKYFSRLVFNSLVRFESFFFENITIISKSLADYLKLNQNKIQVLPVGSRIISQTAKSFDEFNLLYVGALHNRNIEQTITGFDKFYNEFKGKINLQYTIIGYGNEQDEKNIIKIIKEKKLENVVQFLGLIPYNQIKSYFDSHNIGISFIPITDYFDPQPPIKTFDYILSGMAVLGTSTKENRKIINEINGILITDNYDAFYNGLKKLFYNRKLYNSKEIRKTCQSNLIENVVNKNLKEYIENILKSN